MEPSAQFKKLPTDPVVLDLVISVVSFGEVDERPGEDSEKQREKFVERKHLYEVEINITIKIM